MFISSIVHIHIYEMSFEYLRMLQDNRMVIKKNKKIGEEI